MDVLKSLELCTLNERSSDNFTYISSVGHSVVDYCVVELEDYHKFSHFAVTTMLELMEELEYHCRITSIFQIIHYYHGKSNWMKLQPTSLA